MPESRSTKERILDAAEALFARRGFAATSMRLITRTADVNLAAVNYHFGSKANLVESVFRRGLRPLNEERLARLEALPEAGRTVADVLRAFLGPAFEMLASREERDRQFIRLLARSHTDEMAGTKHFMDRLYAGALGTFRSALAAVMPGIPESELTWRLHFVAGATSYAMAGRDVLGILGTDDAGDNAAMDADAVGTRLLPFLTAGLCAPLHPAVRAQADDPRAHRAPPSLA